MLKELPAVSNVVYAPSFHARGYTKIVVGDNTEQDEKLLGKGLLFETKAEASDMTEAIFDILDKAASPATEEPLSADDDMPFDACEPLGVDGWNAEEPVVDEDEPVDTPDSEESVEEYGTPTEDDTPQEEPQTEDEPVSNETQTENENVSEKNTSEEEISNSSQVVVTEEEKESLLGKPTVPSIAESIDECSKLFDFNADTVINSTPFSAKTRIAGATLLDHVEEAREDFVMFSRVKNKLTAEEATAEFVSLVREIPRNLRAQVISVMGSRPFAEMLVGMWSAMHKS